MIRASFDADRQWQLDLKPLAGPSGGASPYRDVPLPLPHEAMRAQERERASGAAAVYFVEDQPMPTVEGQA